MDDRPKLAASHDLSRPSPGAEAVRSAGIGRPMQDMPTEARESLSTHKELR